MLKFGDLATWKHDDAWSFPKSFQVPVATYRSPDGRNIVIDGTSRSDFPSHSFEDS